MILVLPFNASPRYSYQEEIYLPTPDDCKNTVVVANAIVELFERHFQRPMPQFILKNSLTFEYPQTLRDIGEIQLCCENSLYNQFVYQLSHELCHWMIPSDVTVGFRWFEESICETASLFFLDALSRCWPSFIFADYETFLISYRTAQMEKATPINIAALFDGESVISKHLKKVCYDRPVNTFIATQMLPAFQAHPAAWQTVPFLCTLKEEMSFDDALSVLVEWSPEEAKPGWALIQKTFCRPDPYSSS